MKPRSYVGLDQSPEATELCRRVYAVPGLTFVTGDAQRLPFTDQCFDAVINIEASGNYRDIELFLKEVVLVLRPKGYLLLADFRQPANMELLKQQCARAGLGILEDVDVTPNVASSMDLDHERKAGLIMKLVPRFAARAFLQFAGTPGSRELPGPVGRDDGLPQVRVSEGMSGKQAPPFGLDQLRCTRRTS